MEPPPFLEIGELLRSLHDAGVLYVVTGSVAAMAYGVPAIPRDLDIAPDLETGNLERLARILRHLGAKPKYDPNWSGGLSHEQCASWVPDPTDVSTLDHRLVTPHGEVDVVPLKSGSFADLGARAIGGIAFGVPVRIAHLEHLILQCQQWNRERDRRRLRQLLEARVRLEREGLPADITERLTTR